MPSKTLSVVVPVYYNAASLPELARELAAFEALLAQRDVGLELIFVNDGSGDDSLRALLDIKKQRPATKVISLSRNFGANSAALCGLSYVTGDAFAWLAADLQERPEHLMPMVERWLEGHKFVVAVRASRGDPPLQRAFAALYYAVVRTIVAPDYPKTGSSLMLMDRAMLPYLINSPRNTNPNMYAYWLGFPPAIVPYHRLARRHGRSRWTFGKRLKMFVDTICGFSVVPIRTMSLLGVGFAFLSLLYAARIAAAALYGQVPVPGFATIAVLISFFSGMILIMLGTLGEYLWRVFDVLSNRPESVVDETFL